MEEDPYINSIAKGKLSLAEALKEIQSVRLAFQKAERIEQKLQYHDAWIHEIKSSISSLTTHDYVNMKFEELSSKLENLIKKNFEEFISNNSFQLNEKVGFKDFESGLSQKVTWMAFNNFAQQMNSVKSRVEKHIMSDFEGFKTKVKIELSKKANEKKPEEEFSFEEIHQLKNRVTSLEQKYHDMFVEEGLDESDDYDSQEEMDGIMDDIDRTVMREREDSDEGNGEQEDEQVGNIRQETPTTQGSDPIKVSTFASPVYTSPENLSQEEEKKEEVPKEEAKKDVFKKEEVQKSSEIKKEENKKIEEIKEEPKKAEEIVFKQEQKKTEEVKLPVQEKSSELEQVQKEETKSKVLPKIIVPENLTLDEQPKTPGRAKLEMDNLEPQAKHSRTKGGGSSRNDNQTLSRKNSMVSSRSGTNAGGAPANMRNVNKKITALQKDIDGYKQALDESKQTLLEYQEEIAKAYDRISQVRMECQEVEVRRQAMEQSFIKALRRNGIERKMKSKAIALNTISAKQMDQIRQQIEEKSKKLVSVNSYVEKIAADTQAIKTTQKNRINEVIQYMRYLDDSRQQLYKQFIQMSETIKLLEQEMRGNVSNIKQEVASLQGPIVDLISEQQRENKMLNEDIKTQQNLIYEVIEGKMGFTPKSGNGIRGRSESNPATAPDLSVKYKLASAKGGTRKTTAKTNENWLEMIPDGNPLILPRISGRSSPQGLRGRKML